MQVRPRFHVPERCPISAVFDIRLLAWAAVWTVVTLIGFGVMSAIIPNAVFGRSIPPEPFAIWVWIVSAPLMGLVMATYTAPMPSAHTVTLTLPDRPGAGADLAEATLASAVAVPAAVDASGSKLGMIGGFGTFLAIGCPECNKIALLLLGSSGALSIWAPLQPIVGAASLLLLAASLMWRLRIRARGGGCPV